MFKYVLFLTFVVSLASAATISAMCDGVTTFGTTSASCNGPGPVFAMIQTSPTFAASASASAFRNEFTSASVSGVFLFTAFGGTGQGFFYPCFQGLGDHDAVEQGSFGGVSVDFDGSFGNNCEGFDNFLFPLSKPLTFGISQIVPFQIAVSATASLALGAYASLSFEQLIVFDAFGNRVPNVTYALVSVPEPSALSLLSIGLMFFGAVRLRGMRCLHLR